MSPIVKRRALETFWRRYTELRASGHAHDAYELALQDAWTVAVMLDPTSCYYEVIAGLEWAISSMEVAS